METTAITMSITIWLLLKHPEISQKVVQEVKDLKECPKDLNTGDQYKINSSLKISDIFPMKIIIGSVPTRQFRRASRVQFCRL